MLATCQFFYRGTLRRCAGTKPCLCLLPRPITPIIIPPAAAFLLRHHGPHPAPAAVSPRCVRRPLSPPATGAAPLPRRQSVLIIHSRAHIIIFYVRRSHRRRHPQVITMPGPGATDPADLQAHARANLGLSRQLEQTRRKAPHPFHGGRGYDTWYPWEQLDKAAVGADVDVSLSSIRRWRE